jgi:TorA maturation chaperone TorD
MNTIVEDAATSAFHKLANVAQHRSDLYRLLALAFSNPTEDNVTDLQSGALVENFQQSLDALGINDTHYGNALRDLIGFTVKHQADDPAVLLSQLRVEYMRMFIGPRHPVTPLYETLHREPIADGASPMLIVSETAVDVERCYREAGLKRVTSESPDHLATELEFMIYLCGKEADAWLVDNNTMAKKWRRLEREFLDAHLGAWGLPLMRQVKELSAERLYQHLAALAETFLHVETGAFQPR